MQVQSRLDTQPHDRHDSEGFTPLQTGAPPPDLDDAYATQAQLGRTSLSAASEQSVQAAFARSFREAASDPQRFNALMQGAFGADYDKAAAEDLRQRALSGDLSWLPNVRFVSSETLHGANGAYDAASGTVLLNRDKRWDAGLMAETYAEETGHHLDTLLNKSDTVGDEGEMFRRLLAREVLSASQVTAIQTENDHGSIVLDGKRVAVEYFWNPISAIGDVVGSGVDLAKDAVGGAADALSSGASAVGHALVRGANTAANVASDAGSFVGGAIASALSAASDVASGAWQQARGLGRAVWNSTSGVLSSAYHWFQRSIGDASAWTAKALETAWNWTKATTRDASRVVKDELVRVRAAAKTLKEGVFDATVGVAKNLVETGVHFSRGMGYLLTGDFKSGGEELGLALWGVPQTAIDAAILIGGKTISAVQMVAHIEDPGRTLTGDEIAEMRKIFGDSIDYSVVEIKEGDSGVLTASGRAFVLGNTIYMPEGVDIKALAHEMTHVWQHQNGGTDYLTDSLVPRYITGSEKTAYDWTRSVPGTPWSELNPEQQGAFMGAAGAANAFKTEPPAFTSKPDKYDGSLAALNAYLQDAVKEVRRGAWY